MRQAGALLGARALAQLSMLGVSVLVARAVGPSDFGVYSALLAMGTLIAAGIGSGFPVLALRRVAAGDFDKPLLRRMGLVQLGLGAGASVIVAISSTLLLETPGAFAMGAVSGMSFVAFSSLTLASNFHAGAGQYRTASAGESAAAVAVAAFSSLAIAAGFGIMAALMAFGLAQGVGAAFLWSRLPERSDGVENVVVSRFRLTDALPFVALGLAAGGYVRLDAVLVSAVATTTVVGQYAAAYRFLGLFSLLASVFGTVFLSRMSALSPEEPEWRRLRQRATVLFAAIALPLMSVAFTFAPFLVRGVYGQAYNGAATPARWLLLSVVPYCLYLPAAFSLVASKRERRWVALLLLGTITDLTAVLLFVPRWGAAGAAAAWLLAESVVLVSVLASLRSRPACSGGGR